MIIHRPDIKAENGEICVSARIEFQTFIKDMPDEFWFKFPEGYSDLVTDSADGFAASLLLLALALGEEMEVRGQLSQRLLYGMKEYQRVFNLWRPDKFKIIDIICNGFRKQENDKAKGAVGCAFSGGVDSFYSLWSHLPQNEPLSSYQLTHALFVHGFDIPLEDAQTYLICKQSYEELMGKLGLGLLTARTNVSHFLKEKIGWGYVCGQVLIGVALVLGRLFSRFYIPAGHTYTQNVLLPYGSCPILDHLLGTETLEVIHDGAGVTRVEKTLALTQWPLTYPLLRVCAEKTNGPKNCCLCEKCIRTMVTLEISGTLGKYTNFPLPLKRKNIRNCVFRFKNSLVFAQDNIKYAIMIGRKDIVFDIVLSLLRRKLGIYLTRFVSGIIPISYMLKIKNKIIASKIQ